MSKILLVSGCSYSDEKWTSIHHPELDVSWPKWPQLLAKKLDMQLVNLSESGAGQAARDRPRATHGDGSAPLPRR